MEEAQKATRREKIIMLAERWLEIKGYDVKMWDITTSMYIYADDWIVNIEYRMDAAMSWNPRQITVSKEDVQEKRNKVRNPFAQEKSDKFYC